MLKTLNSIEQIEEVINNNSIAVMVFSTHSCGVCAPLKQKVSKKVEGNKRIAYGEVFIDDVKDVQGKFQVYTAPIILVFVERKETKRYSAAIDITEFEKVINRYVDLIYG